MGLRIRVASTSSSEGKSPSGEKEIRRSGQIVTKRVERDVPCIDGHWAYSPDEDLVLAASIERHQATGKDPFPELMQKPPAGQPFPGVAAEDLAASLARLFSAA